MPNGNCRSHRYKLRLETSGQLIVQCICVRTSQFAWVRSADNPWFAFGQFSTPLIRLFRLSIGEIWLMNNYSYIYSMWYARWYYNNARWMSWIKQAQSIIIQTCLNTSLSKINLAVPSSAAESKTTPSCPPPAADLTNNCCTEHQYRMRANTVCMCVLETTTLIYEPISQHFSLERYLLP